jgi:serine/threonine protein kinase
MALSAGDRLGAYEILAPLGAGGMGEVYRAHDGKLGRDVAIKILSLLNTDPPEDSTGCGTHLASSRSGWLLHPRSDSIKVRSHVQAPHLARHDPLRCPPGSPSVSVRPLSWRTSP